MSVSRPYESTALRSVTGPAIRPGDLDLTCHAARYCGVDSGDRVLDVGCGVGATLAALKEHFQVATVGLDLSELLLAEARRSHGDLSLIRGAAMLLPLAPERFAAIFCECVLSLQPDPIETLKEFYRVLEPGGKLVITDLYCRGLDASSADSAAGLGGCLKGAASRDGLIQWIESVGFRLLVWEDHSPLLKTLTARLVWAGISIREFWGLECGRCESNPSQQFGYCLLVAQKRKYHHG